jgi:hypothetical protein
MARSGRAASAVSSADCSGVRRLVGYFFISLPFMRGGLASTDDPAHRFVPFGIALGPCVNYEQQYRPDNADSLPAVAVRMRVGLRCVERVIEYERCCLE